MGSSPSVHSWLREGNIANRPLGRFLDVSSDIERRRAPRHISRRR